MKKRQRERKREKGRERKRKTKKAKEKQGERETEREKARARESEKAKERERERGCKAHTTKTFLGRQEKHIQNILSSNNKNSKKHKTRTQALVGSLQKDTSTCTNTKTVTGQKDTKAFIRHL